jgi:hypothetical protein
MNAQRLRIIPATRLTRPCSAGRTSTARWAGWSVSIPSPAHRITNSPSSFDAQRVVGIHPHHPAHPDLSRHKRTAVILVELHRRTTARRSARVFLASAGVLTSERNSHATPPEGLWLGLSGRRGA